MSNPLTIEQTKEVICGIYEDPCAITPQEGHVYFSAPHVHGGRVFRLTIEATDQFAMPEGVEYIYL